MQSRYEYGVDAENIALSYLKTLHFELVAKRFKSPYGEIDLIVKHSKTSTLLFVEIKARKNLKEHEVLTHKQIQRINSAADYFLSLNQAFLNYEMRFDFILIRGSQIESHIENAWGLNY